MPFYAKLFSILLVFLFIIIFIFLLRKRSIRPFYSLLWLFITLLILSVLIFESFFKWVATQLGLTDASFLIFVGVIFFLLIYVLHLSIKVSEMSDRIQELISFTSILENQIRKEKAPDG